MQAIDFKVGVHKTTPRQLQDTLKSRIHGSGLACLTATTTISKEIAMVTDSGTIDYHPSDAALRGLSIATISGLQVVKFVSSDPDRRRTDLLVLVVHYWYPTTLRASRYCY